VDPSLDPTDVAYAGAVGSLDLMRDGRLTSAELVDLCLSRIDALDGRFRAFRVVFREQARAAARDADESRGRGDDRPLLGLPVAVKDNVAVAGHAAAHGTASPEPVAARDDEQVRRLRAAGAVVVGTTHLPELALWPFTESATWGDTRNPWDPGRTTGGSSGGSAAAVAAGMVPAATASDGGGSIRIPAAACGLVGLKPQRGRVPLGAGTCGGEHWHGLSSAGVLTRTVADTALLLSVLTAGAVPAELPAPGTLAIAWTTRAPVRTPVSDEVEAALHEALRLLRELGHRVERRDPDYRRVQASFLPRYARGARDDLVRLVDPSATERRTRVVAAAGARVSDRLLERAASWGTEAATRLARLPGDADVLVTPVLAAPAGAIGSLAGLRAVALAGSVVPFTPAWNVTGQPAISVPVGLSRDGLPVAVQLVGRPASEHLLLGLAAQLEQRTGFPARRPPSVASTP
jgi:amidase